MGSRRRYNAEEPGWMPESGINTSQVDEIVKGKFSYEKRKYNQ